MLSVQNISFSYNSNNYIFKNISFDLKEGEIITLLGPNGSGKSTLFDCIVNIISPQNGEIIINKKNVKEYKQKDLANVITLVSQHIKTAFDFSVKEFVMMGAAPRVGFMSSPGEREEKEAIDALKSMDILKFKDRIFSELSGGERQQVSIAKAIMQNPKIILFDEPTSYLDIGNQQKVIKLIKKMASQGYAIIISTHNPDHAIQLGGRCAILKSNGELLISDYKNLCESDLQEIYKIPLKLIEINEIGRIACILP